MSERSESQPSQEQMLQALYAFAAESMRGGAADDEVVRRLTLQGANKSLASKIVEELSAARAKAYFKSGKRNMLYGVSWFVGGALFTLVTYASAEPGGRYFVAWGAMLVGVIQFFRGLNLFKKYSPGGSRNATLGVSSSTIVGQDLKRQVDLQLHDPTQR